MKTGQIVQGKDGEQYVIVRLETTNPYEPSMNRYLVKRVSNGDTISNFPGYMLRMPKKGK